MAASVATGSMCPKSALSPVNRSPHVASAGVTASGTTPGPGSHFRHPSGRVEPARSAHPGLLVSLLACLALALASLLVPATALYDPMAWLVWGRDVAALDLDTRGLGPAWKPLPVLADLALAALGSAAVPAWLVMARTAGLLALALAYRLAARLAGPVAGVLAVLLLAASTDYLGELLPGGMSEPLLVLLSLLALERALAGRTGAALAALSAAALVRPEVWPFLGAYGLLLWMRDPRRRAQLVALAGLQALLWFGAELWGSGDALRSSHRAGMPSEGGPLLTDFPGLAVLGSALTQVPAWAWPGVLVAAGAAVADVARGRGVTHQRLAVALLVLGAGWAAVVAAMTVAGVSSGDQRYLLVTAACAAALAGAGWVRAGGWIAGRLRCPGRAERAAGVAAALVAVALLGAGVVDAGARLRQVRAQAELRADESERVEGLAEAVRRAGGRPALLSCGPVATGPYEVPYVAWELRTSLPDIAVEPSPTGVVLSARAAPLPPPPAFRAIALDGLAARHWELFTTCPLPGAAPPR